jgi:hypothetical protein
LRTADSILRRLRTPWICEEIFDRSVVVTGDRQVKAVEGLPVVFALPQNE